MSHVGDDPVLRLEGVSKTFPGTRALCGVGLGVASGEVHALVGANGSGKSTLIKILAGYHRADPGGRAWLEGEPLDVVGVGEARHERLRFVHQDLGLVLELGVMDNLALRHRFVRGRLGRIDWVEQARQARLLLKRFDVALSLRKPLSEATPVQRVIVAIVAALQGWDGGGGLLVLDEPTAVLPPSEVEHLFAIIAEVKRAGTSVLYVSHRMDEIFDVADRVSVLRNGELISTEPVSALSARRLVHLVAGEEVFADYRADVMVEAGAPVALETRRLAAHYMRDVSVSVREGEIVGLAGLPGSGREELPYVLAGAYGRAARGQLRLGDTDWVDAAQAGSLGLPLVPADRASEAVISQFSLRENVSLPLVSRLRSRGRLDRSREQGLAREWIGRLRIRTASTDASITTLSGGNQQKVVIARCLAQEPRVLLLCEPTAGVDIATRVAIYDLIAEQAKQGLAVIVSSSDIEDLLGICSRVLVMRDGMIASEITADGLTQKALLHAMEGGGS